MTLRRAVAVFPRPWIDGSVTVREWLLASAVIQAAIAKDEARPAVAPAASEGRLRAVLEKLMHWMPLPVPTSSSPDAEKPPMNCGCLEHAEPNTCASCVYGFCTRCTFPQEIECRRHAPAVGERRGVFPMVRREAWCGDFESRDTLDALREEVTSAKAQANQWATKYYEVTEASTADAEPE